MDLTPYVPFFAGMAALIGVVLTLGVTGARERRKSRIEREDAYRSEVRKLTAELELHTMQFVWAVLEGRAMTDEAAKASQVAVVEKAWEQQSVTVTTLRFLACADKVLFPAVLKVQESDRHLDGRTGLPWLISAEEDAVEAFDQYHEAALTALRELEKLVMKRAMPTVHDASFS